jgi:phosphoribosyl 1,2-cyclic phosphodiesterase
MRIALLASGSSGNSLLVQSGSTSVLVDAGMSARRLSQAACAAGSDLRSITAVLVTHGHTDHVSGLAALPRTSAASVYATEGTLREIDRFLTGGRTAVAVAADRPFDVGDLVVSPFGVSHDAAEPVGFSISDGVHRLTVATDLGTVDDPVREHLGTADCVVLECNHDERMLLDGPYPWSLKRRILADTGHLSNGAASREIERMGSGPISVLVLAHLSRRNNTPDLAFEAAAGALERAGRSDVEVLVGEQFGVVGPIDTAVAVRPAAALASRGTGRRCTE